MSDIKRTAQQVHSALLAAIEQLKRAEKSAVLQFAEIRQRRLYRDLGYSCIQSYASEAFGFSDNKARQFIRLAESFEALPKLKRALKENKISWTKARSVARVASGSTEKQWIDLAEGSSSRQLEEKIGQARRQSGEKRPQLFSVLEAEPLPAPKAHISSSLAPELKGKLDACIESLRKHGDRRSRDELLVAAFSLLATAIVA